MKKHALILFGSLILSLALRADTIYSTFGPDPYAPALQTQLIQWSAAGGNGSGRGVASPFLFTGSPYELTSVTLDIGGLIQNPNLQIGIFYDNGDSPSLTPVTVLEPNPTFITSSERQMHRYDFSAGYVLNPGQRYWLVLQPAFLNTTNADQNVFYFSATSMLQPSPGVAVRNYEGPAGWENWTVFPDNPALVFELNGAAVPEPNTWALLTLGGALFWFAARRRRK